MPVIYIDVVFLVNVVMDAVLLWTTGWIAKRNLRFWRVCLGALIGALYALILFVPSLSFLTSWPGKVIVSVFMVAAAYPTRNWIETIRLTVLYYFVSFVFAGATIALHFAIPGSSIRNGLVLTNQQYAIATSFQGLALVAAIPAGFGILRYAFRRVRQIRVSAGMLQRVAVGMDGQRIEFLGLVDTGNQLHDPISQRPVCLVDADVLQPLLPPELQLAVAQRTDLVQALSRMTDHSWSQRIALIPFRGAGGVGKMMVAVRAEKFEVWRQEAWQSAPTCYLAVHFEKLSLDNRFQAILHTDVITGDDGFEGKLTSTELEHEIKNSSAIVVDSTPGHPRWRL